MKNGVGEKKIWMITMLIIALLLVQFTPRVVFAENEENVEISPTLMPSVTPTAVPTEQPESSPEGTPTAIPTDVPTATPTDTPIVTPTEQPEPSPEEIPIVTPTDIPTVTPADTPIVTPTEQPEPSPEETPIVTPTDIPAVIPTDIPTVTPTETPIVTPTEQPESSPEERPSVTPTIETPMISPTNALNEPQPDQENAYNFLFTPYSDNGDEPEVSCKYNVKIRYGDFNFSYNYGAQWNPETHRYEAGTAINSGWMSSDWNEYNCRIVIVNGVDSNYPLTVTVKSKIESGKLNSDANSRGAVVGVFTDTLSDFGTLISMDGKYMSGYLIVDDKYVEPTPITVDVNDTKHWDKESGEYIEELGKFCGLASGTPGNREYIKQIFFALSGVPDLDYKYGDANLFEPIGQISLVFKPATDGVEVYPKK